MLARLLDLPRVFLPFVLLSSVVSAPSYAAASAQLSDSDSMPIRVVTPNFVQAQYPQPRLQQLAFSPDGAKLAFTTREPTQTVVDNSPLFADTLKLLTIGGKGSIETLVDTDVTRPFGYYGAPIFQLQWQQDRISFQVGDGDVDASQLDYVFTEHRLADPEGREVSGEVELLPSATAQALKQCFNDWPADAVPERPDQLIEQTGSDYLFFQPNYRGVAANVWAVKRNGCQRQSLALPLPTDQVKLLHAVVNANRLTLVLSQTGERRKTFVWQTNLDDVQQHKPLVWQDFSYGLPKGINGVTPLGTAQQQQLLLLNNRDDCSEQLISVGPKGIQQIKIDGQRLCNAAMHANGQLALALSKETPAADANGDAQDVQAEQLWLVKPAFLAALQH